MTGGNVGPVETGIGVGAGVTGAGVTGMGVTTTSFAVKLNV